MHTSEATPDVVATTQTSRRMLALASGSVGALVAIVQLRHGIVPLLDTVTYWSGAQSVADGHLFGTTLAPSFSNFDAIDFLERGGRLPFVDFPVLYPLLSGSIGTLIGTRAAMHVLAVSSMFGICAAIVRGTPRSSARALMAVTLFALFVPFLPAVRLVTQGTLSEPLFIASTLLLVVSLARFRSGGSWSLVVALVVTSSLLRFLGAPLALLAGWEHFGRRRRAGSSILWTTAMIAPAITNMILASISGGGHSAGWRGLDRLDIDVFVRSVGGWFDATQGDLRRTYFTQDGPSSWSWPVTVAVLAAMGWGTLRVLRRSRTTCDTADLAFTSAAILTVGLFAGMLGFDALVIADNRLMLPVGVLVSAAIVWRVSASSTTSRVVQATGLCCIVLWGAFAARPWDVLERFSDVDRPLTMSQVALDLNAEIIVSNDADGVHWDTGLPAAYAPMRVKPLTGEIVDDTEIYRKLPCALLSANGAVVISNEATFSSVDRSALDKEVSEGRLKRLTTQETTAYLPSDTACGP